MKTASFLRISASLSAALLAACAGHGAMLPTQSSPAFSNANVEANVSPDGCSDPKTLKACLKPGGTHQLHITLTCYLGTQPAGCGTVTWSTKVSDKLIKARFKPEPGNPTVETITAAKTVKVGHYSQEINAKCTGVPNCDFNQKGLIWIVK